MLTMINKKMNENKEEIRKLKITKNNNNRNYKYRLDKNK